MRTYRRSSSLWAFLTVVALALAPAAASDAEVLLSMPEPPDGYMVVKQPIEINGTLAGQTVAVVKDGSPARVVISVETAVDRSSQPFRVTATKAYVNAMSGTLKKMGMELLESKLPDLANADFTTPLQTDMTFSQPDGTKFYVRQFVFFTKHGYNIQIASNNPQDVETLTKWAQHIKPAD